MTQAKDEERGLTLSRLKQALHYDHETGVFTWKEHGRGGHHRGIGRPAGSLKRSGYTLINLNQMRFRAHRLAWFYMTGAWPKGQVDHINGERNDNRWTNLRLASQVQNSANMKPRRTNRLGIKGVRQYDGLNCTRYRSIISIGGNVRYLGSFKSLDEAKSAYLKAARHAWGEYARV